MKRQLLALALLATLSAAAAPKLRVDTDKDAYDLGETMTFLVTAQENGAPVAANVTWELKSDFGQNDAKGQATLDPAAPLKVEAKMTKPGFARLTVKLADENFKPVKDVRFIASAGAALDQLKGVPEPADFDAWWAKQRKIVDAVDLSLAAVKDASPAVAEKHKGMKVRSVAIPFEVDGKKQLATAWLIMPEGAAEKSVPFLTFQFQGYGFGGRTPTPWYNKTQAITLDVNAHGFELDREPEYYKEFEKGIRTPKYGYAFSPEENAKPETAYFRNMAFRVMRALQYVKSLPEWNGRSLVAEGGSQGGLQTSWAAGLDPDVTLARPSITWGCDFAMTSGARQRLKGPWYIPYAPGLDYFDSINHIRRAKCPVEITRAGLGDYTCPPSGLAAYYNAISAPKSILWVQGSRHGYIPPDPNQKFLVSAGHVQTGAESKSQNASADVKSN